MATGTASSSLRDFTSSKTLELRWIDLQFGDAHILALGLPGERRSTQT
jgi:hypothetical protein